MLNFAEIDKLKMIPAAKNFNLFINKIENAKISIPRKWKYEDWPYISKFKVFKKK